MQILFATSNPNKVREVAAVLAPLGMEVVTLDSLSECPPEPVEDGDSFAANARLKAIGYALATGRRCLAEDSGLWVDALGGAPGVHSARYAGTTGEREQRDAANNRKLLAAIRGVPPDQRAARFVCAMCVAEPSGEILVEVSGSFEGQITEQPAGNNGFGYDPLLFVPDAGCTSAELSAAEKNRRSHRGQAARALAAALAELKAAE